MCAMAPIRETVIHRSRWEKQDIEVVDTPIHRSLYFGKRTLQSRQFTKSPHLLALSYTQYMMSNLLLFNNVPSRILLIGLGGGSLVSFIHHFFPTCQVEAVDNSSNIIKIAKTYFRTPCTDNVQIYCENGVDYVTRIPSEKKYDLILLDAFNQHGMSTKIYNASIFEKCTAHLSSSGVLSCNLWSGEKSHLEQVQQDLENSLKSTIFIPVSDRGNIVSHSMNKKLPWQNFLRPAKNMQQWQRKYHIDFSHISTEASKHNLSFRQRLSLCFMPRAKPIH